MADSVLITGANRGIGLALVREYVRRGWDVYASCRQPDEAKDLNAIASEHPDSVEVFRLDVTRPESAAAASQYVWSKTEALDLLINNAGIFAGPSAETKLNELELEDCCEAFRTNVLGVGRVTRAMLPLLQKAGTSKIVNITSGIAVISAKTRPGYYAYGTSKAALNYFSRAMAAEIRGTGPILALISPGWVKTDMGGSEAELTPEQSARGIAETIDKLTADDNGCWFNWDGRPQEAW